jgi:hypothetical protein
MMERGRKCARDVRETGKSPSESLHTPGDRDSNPTMEVQVGVMPTELLQRVSLFRLLQAIDVDLARDKRETTVSTLWRSSA